MEDLPYKAEYAKSGRASCKGCKSPIAQESLRLAVMVQSFHFDGKTPNWFHYKCFFNKQRPKSTDDIAHFESLRLNDQETIRKLIEESSTIVVPAGKGKKRGADKASKGAVKDFKIEYAKSARATCRGCEQKILKEEIRISKKDFTTEIGMKYGGQDMWHHLSCFAKLRSELGYFAAAAALPGYKTLKANDRKEADNVLPAIKQEEVPEIKKMKTEDAVDGKEDKLSKDYAAQNKIIFKYRDQLKDNLKKQELVELLEINGQSVPSGRDNQLDHLADIMTFGALTPCETCNNGQLVFDKYGYKCKGDLTEWTKCNNMVKVPKRVPFKVPTDMAVLHSFLKKYKYVARERVVKDNPNPTNGVKKEEKEEGEDKPKVERELPVFYNMEFIILGRPARGKDELKKQIAKLGGKVITKFSESVMAVVASKEEVEKMGARIEEAKLFDIQVVPEEFVDEAPKHAKKIPDLIVKMSLCDWGSDPSGRLPPEPSSSTLKSKSKSIYTSGKSAKVNLKLKGGGAVDPDSGLEDVAHVYQDRNDKYTTVLGKTDIQTNQNSFYKIQLLKSDNSDRYWVFRSWGRIGTNIGSNKLEKFHSLHDAKMAFENIYEERTGNDWYARQNCVKMPGKYYPVDVCYDEDEAKDKLDIVEAPSKLDKSVQDLMKLIFDVNSMKKVMLEFELDTEKMPLGKLSKKQIQSAFGVLSELQDLINNNAPEIRFIDASNRFYTFIPHSFGIDKAPILNDPEVIKQKLEMLDSLMELEIAYNLMKSSGSNHTVDSYYEQLKTEINVISKDHEEFKIIEEYVRNTHAETHRSYELDIVEVFAIKRHGEEKRFKPFKKLPNRKLLWHGSRTTNFAGILAQGLRIAPPEAPVTGYMFGKGIYFADMVSKSANYCCTSPSNSTGLLLLSDVALGHMYEKTQAEYVEKLPKGKHSCKGIGRTHPDPKHVKIIDDVEVPLGKGVPAKVTNSSLLYNEYIVYDVAQVNVKYLLRVNFKYTY